MPAGTNTKARREREASFPSCSYTPTASRLYSIWNVYFSHHSLCILEIACKVTHFYWISSSQYTFIFRFSQIKGTDQGHRFCFNLQIKENLSPWSTASIKILWKVWPFNGIYLLLSTNTERRRAKCPLMVIKHVRSNQGRYALFDVLCRRDSIESDCLLLSAVPSQ